jgi:hypothetical protein
MFANITNYKNTGDWLYLTTGATVVDLAVIFMTKYPGPKPAFGVKALNDWYTRFGALAAVSDILSVLIGIFFARLIYAQLGGPVWVFVASILGFQLFHDILFYLGVIIPLRKGENEMIDVFKAYAAENGFGILFADAAILLGSAGIGSFLKALPEHYTTGTLLVTLYALCYVLYTKSA